MAKVSSLSSPLYTAVANRSFSQDDLSEANELKGKQEMRYNLSKIQKKQTCSTRMKGEILFANMKVYVITSCDRYYYYDPCYLSMALYDTDDLGPNPTFQCQRSPCQSGGGALDGGKMLWEVASTLGASSGKAQQYRGT